MGIGTAVVISLSVGTFPYPVIIMDCKSVIVHADLLCTQTSDYQRNLHVEGTTNTPQSWYSPLVFMEYVRILKNRYELVFCPIRLDRLC